MQPQDPTPINSNRDQDLQDLLYRVASLESQVLENKSAIPAKKVPVPIVLVVMGAVWFTPVLVLCALAVLIEFDWTPQGWSLKSRDLPVAQIVAGVGSTAGTILAFGAHQWLLNDPEGAKQLLTRKIGLKGLQSASPVDSTDSLEPLEDPGKYLD